MFQDSTSAPLTFAQDLVRHNLVVFRSGEGALQVLPALVDVIPEARLNLVIYYLKQVRLIWFRSYSAIASNIHDYNIVCWNCYGIISFIR